MHTHVFMQQKSNWIFKLASNLLHAAVFADARPMQQVFCCMVQTCLIGLMQACVSIIVAAKLLHLWCSNVWRAQCLKTDTHQPSTHICSSFIAAKLMHQPSTHTHMQQLHAAVTCSSFDAWLLQHITHSNWFVQQNCCTNDAAMYAKP